MNITNYPLRILSVRGWSMLWIVAVMVMWVAYVTLWYS